VCYRRINIIGSVTCNPAEVSGHQWLTVDQICERLSANSNRNFQLRSVLFEKMIDSEM